MLLLFIGCFGGNGSGKKHWPDDTLSENCTKKKVGYRKKSQSK